MNITLVQPLRGNVTQSFSFIYFVGCQDTITPILLLVSVRRAGYVCQEVLPQAPVPAFLSVGKHYIFQQPDKSSLFQ